MCVWSPKFWCVPPGCPEQASPSFFVFGIKQTSGSIFERRGIFRGLQSEKRLCLSSSLMDSAPPELRTSSEKNLSSIIPWFCLIRFGLVWRISPPRIRHTAANEGFGFSRVLLHVFWFSPTAHDLPSLQQIRTKTNNWRGRGAHCALQSRRLPPPPPTQCRRRWFRCSQTRASA